MLCRSYVLFDIEVDFSPPLFLRHGRFVIVNMKEENKLVAARLVHEVDGEKRKELKLHSWESRPKGAVVWRLWAPYVKHPCGGVEHCYHQSDAHASPSLSGRKQAADK